jgi:hypothetical protein
VTHRLVACKIDRRNTTKSSCIFFSGARFSTKKNYRKEGTFAMKIFRYTNTVMCISNFQYYLSYFMLKLKLITVTKATCLDHCILKKKNEYNVLQ